MDIFWLGRTELRGAEHALESLPETTAADAGDQIWLLEPEPAFALGASGRAGQIHAPGAIPVLHTRRGGPPCYHGPGQVVALLLLRATSRERKARESMHRMEEAALRLLRQAGLTGHRVSGATGVYVRLDDPWSHDLLPQRPMRRVPGSPRQVPDFSSLGRIAQPALRQRRGWLQGTLTLNVAMDLAPFARISAPTPQPSAVDLATLGVVARVEEAARSLALELQRTLA